MSATRASTSADKSGQLAFTPAAISASAGNVTVALTNNSPVAHGLTIVSGSGAVLASVPVFDGGAKSVSVNLKAGKYTFYCQVPGHRQAGMTGTLTVN